MKTVDSACWCLLLVFATCVPAQEQAGSPLAEQSWTAMYAAWERGGEPALREYVRQNRQEVSHDLIVDIATRGATQRSDPALSETRLSIALAAAREVADRRAEADVLSRAGDYRSYTAEYEGALGYYDQALPLYEELGDLAGQGDVYRRLGEIHNLTGDSAQALAMYEKALPFFEKADSAVGQGIVYARRGEIHFLAGDNAQALAMYEKALPFFEKANSPVGQATVYQGRGDIYVTIGENAQALAMYEKALPFFEGVNDSAGQGNVYEARGAVYVYTGDNAQALAMYDKALAFYESANSPLGQALVYRRRGQVHLLTGENAQALAMYDKALALYEKTNDPSGQGKVYMERGAIYARSGDNAQALAMYDRASHFFEQESSPQDLGTAFLNRGDIYLSISDSEQALAMYDKALPLFEKADEPRGQAEVYRRRGDIYSRGGDNALALAMYDKALPLFETTDEPRGQGDVYRSRGDIYSKGGDNAQALAMYDKALELYTRCGDPTSQADSLIATSQVYARQGRKTEALSGYERALALLERVRRQTGIEKLKGSYLEMVYARYAAAAQFMLESGFRDSAFRVMESMKARLFLDRLAEGLVALDGGIAPEMRQRRDDMESRISALKMQRMKAYGETGPDADMRLANLSAQIDSEEAELDGIRTEIRLKNPLYASVEYPEIVSVPEVREKILRPDEALVEYYLGEQDAWCFVLTREAFDAVKLPAPSTEIQDTVASCVAHPRAAIEARLYGMLVAPIEARLAGKSLVIAPDAALARLPFEMLQKSVDGSPRFLIELYPVAYTQSATVLAFYRTKYHREGTSDSFIGFGDPVYDYESFRADKPERGMVVAGDTPAASAARRGLERAGLQLTRLPGSGAEIASIGALFTGDGRSGTSLLRADAREERAKAPDMSSYRYIHLAAHGILDDSYQAIALSQIPGASEDGMLTLGEIMNLRFDASLVVLSACRTGLGQISRGEGVTGLTRAVMYAGSSAALVSLWNVSDEGTQELMTRFYGHIVRDDLAPAGALRRAKLEMIADPELRDPLLWAAFVQYGE